jgi:hypothetical protein
MLELFMAPDLVDLVPAVLCQRFYHIPAVHPWLASSQGNNTYFFHTCRITNTCLSFTDDKKPVKFLASLAHEMHGNFPRTGTWQLHIERIRQIPGVCANFAEIGQEVAGFDERWV